MAGKPDLEPQFWEVQVRIGAGRADAEQVAEHIRLLLCPDPEHQPPCPVPWEVFLLPLNGDEPELASLRRQVAVEQPGSAPTS